MRPLARILILAALATACDRIGNPLEPGPAAVPTLAAASKSVDPGALTPAPSQVGATAECQTDGQWIICHTTLTIDLVNEPVFDLSCGTVYETSHDVRLGTRWYDAGDSVIVKRHVRQDVSGTWSLSPDGAAPTATLSAHANWYDSRYADVTDLDSGVTDYHGEIMLRAPGFGVSAHIAGLDRSDGGPHRGLDRELDDPAVVAELCAALQ